MRIPIKHGYVEVTTNKGHWFSGERSDKAINLTVFERGEFSSQRADIQLTRAEAIDLMSAITASLLHGVLNEGSES